LIGWLVGFYSSRFVRCFYYYPAQRKIRKFLANFFAGFSVARGKPIATKRRRNEAPPNQKEKKSMKTKVLLLGAIVTAFTFTSFATDALLSPRAAGNQIKVVNSSVETPSVTVTYVTPASPALLSPRAQASQITIVKGVVNERNPYLECRNTMTGSPKAVGACSEHPAMPGCVTVAPLK
jgi:hypothetical protein